MILSIIIAVLIVIFDQITKGIVVSKMTLGESVTIIPNFLKFRFVENTGAAFSSLSDATGLLLFISLIATAALCYCLYKYTDYRDRPLLSVTISFVTGGCIGNLIDRFLTVIKLKGGVTDFIELYIGNKNIIGGSTFNVADAFLVVGCILFIIDILFVDAARDRKKAHPEIKEDIEDGNKENRSN
jgi:signal peptidase II